MSSTEVKARRTLTATVAVSIASAFVAMAVGLNGQQLWAIIALVVAIASAGAAFFAYRSYSSLRESRWQEELRQTERRVSDMLQHEASSTTPAPSPSQLPGDSTNSNPR